MGVSEVCAKSFSELFKLPKRNVGRQL